MSEIILQNHSLVVAIFTLFGLCIGSFLNVVIWRLPEGLTLTGRSHCTTCGKTLKAKHLIPVVSYLALRGKCGFCQSKISARYATIELVTAALFGFTAYTFLFSPTFDVVLFIKALLVVSILICVFCIDLEHMLILDVLILPATVVVALLNVLRDVVYGNDLWQVSLTLDGVIGGVVLMAVFWAIYHFSDGRWMGFGDVKLALFIGMVFGTIGGLMVTYLAIVIGALVGVFLMIFKKKGLKSEVPFGSFYALAGIVVIFFGSQILDLYMNLLHGSFWL